MTYEYKDPSANGYRRVRLSKADHCRLFPARPMKWHNRFEYYLRDTDFLVHRFVGRTAVAISIALFPLSLLIYGVANFKEVWREHVRLVSQKKYGSFSGDQVWARSDSFSEIVKAVTHG